MSWLSKRHAFVSLSCRNSDSLTPDDQRYGDQKDHKAKGSCNKANVLDAHGICPWGKREKNNDGEHISNKSDADHDISEDL